MKSAYASQQEQNSRWRKVVSFAILAGPLCHETEVEVELKHLEEARILHKIKFSTWSTPVITVYKPNGALRIWGDYNITVNPQLQTEKNPLPCIDDTFSELVVGGRKKFTKIDFRQAYHQMGVEEESQGYLTIKTHQGLYRYNRQVFEVASAPAIWQRSVGRILEGLEGTSCIVDDHHRKR